MTITDYPNFTPQVNGAGNWQYETVNPVQRMGLSIGRYRLSDDMLTA